MEGRSTGIAVRYICGSTVCFAYDKGGNSTDCRIDIGVFDSEIFNGGSGTETGNKSDCESGRLTSRFGIIT